MTPSKTESPVCPAHAIPMLPHKFEYWELLERQDMIGFRCPNLTCPIVYIDEREDFYLLEDGKLTSYTESGS